MALLEVNNVSKSFGGVKANVDISLEVKSAGMPEKTVKTVSSLGL